MKQVTIASWFNGRVRVSVPATGRGWLLVCLAAAALALFVRGDTDSAWHVLMFSMLLELTDKRS